MLYDMISKH